ncbi:Arpin [Plecturocebus cupreus]
MSRIYQDGALRNKAVQSARLQGAWDPAAHHGGNGVLLEGELMDVSRHSILDAHGRKERYYVLYIWPSHIHRRQFDAKGNEIEPNFSATRKVNTGFLMSSYKVEAKGDTDRLTLEELKQLVNKPELLVLTERLTPDHTVAFWMPESEMEAIELELGTGVRLKTRGDGPFLELMGWARAGLHGDMTKPLKLTPKSLHKCPGAIRPDSLDPGVPPNPTVPVSDLSPPYLGGPTGSPRASLATPRTGGNSGLTQA